MADHFCSAGSDPILAEEATLPLDQGGGTVTLTNLHASSALLILFAYIGAQFAGAALVGFFAALGAGVNGHDLTNPDLLGQITRMVTAPAAVVGVLLGGMVLLRLTRYFEGCSAHSGFSEHIGWRWGSWWDLTFGLACGALLGLTYLMAAAFLSPAQTWTPSGPLAQMASTPGLSRLYWVVLVLMLAPPFEEFLFRGVLLAGLSRSWGLPAASILVTLLFALVHFPEAMHYWPAMVAITSLGVLALVIRIRAQSLGPAIALHFSYNLVITLGHFA